MPPKQTQSGPRLTRRQFLPGAVSIAALGAGGVAGFELANNTGESGASTDSAQTADPQSTVETVDVAVHSFVTRPDLRPPVIHVSGLPADAGTETPARFVALTPGDVLHNKSVQSGPLIVDRRGRPVWFSPQPGSSYDLQIQSYQGKPVLTWWSGNIVSQHGVGALTILDGSYGTIKTISQVGNHQADLHDFVITSRNTALLTSYQEVKANLFSRGGPTDGSVWAGHVLEVDIATGEVLLDWNSLEHVPISDSYHPYVNGDTSPYDYFHLNSVSEMEDGNLLISSRNTWAVYAIDRSSGKVLWQLGGKRSDFDVAPDAHFSWQHHTRTHGSSLMTVFDNGMNTGDFSKALLLSYDVGSRTVKLVREFLHPARFMSHSLGSVELLPNGNVFVGWGVQPYFAEYTSDGMMVSDAEFPIRLRSYRAFLVDWIGHPTDPPAVVAKANPAGGFVVYASWNGATEIATWTVLAGKDKSSLQPVGTQPWSGFETTIVVNSNGPAFQVVAHDQNGNELGRSEVV